MESVKLGEHGVQSGLADYKLSVYMCQIEAQL